MQEIINFPKKTMLLIALLQGFVLLLLNQAIDLKFWPYPHMDWLYGFYAIAVALPLMLLLGLFNEQQGQLFKIAVPFSLLLGLLGFYVGKQAVVGRYWSMQEFLFAFVVTSGLAVFKAQMYIQQYISGQSFNYSNLFRWSWRNFLTVSLSLLFALAVWGLLMLWAFLFKAINIKFFYELFTDQWFYYPAIALAHGFGIIIFRHLSNVIDVITRLQQALMKYLLLLIVFISLIFMASLPFTGLQVLWKSGGSTLILWMQALMLFFVNAVYQDESHERPYAIWLHRFIFCGVVLLPIYSLISLYGLSLRIEQYGLTISRCWGLLIWLLLALFSIGYCYGIIRHRDNWLQVLSKINVAGGLMVLLAMLLVNSPLLDFRKLTVASQLQLLHAKKIAPEKFDLHYFKRSLGLPGRAALAQLQVEFAQTNPEFVKRIKSTLAERAWGEESELTKAEFLQAITLHNEQTEIPENVQEAVYQYVKANYWNYDSVVSSHLIAVDANQDSKWEYLWVQQRRSYFTLRLFYEVNGKWLNLGVEALDRKESHSAQVEQALKQGDVQVVAPEWQDLKLGDLRYQIK